MTPAHQLVTLAAAKPHHGGGQVASSVFIVVALILIIYILHLRSQDFAHKVAHRALLVVLGAFLISMNGTIPDWLRATVIWIEQLPYYISTWF